ncbi:hypothetical protein G7046_g6744 [Stylonectria norvegica]|nr:hypothetical protein G7046_g6744 [Stylonectria norvegica]
MGKIGADQTQRQIWPWSSDPPPPTRAPSRLCRGFDALPVPALVVSERITDISSCGRQQPGAHRPALGEHHGWIGRPLRTPITNLHRSTRILLCHSFASGPSIEALDDAKPSVVPSDSTSLRVAATAGRKYTYVPGTCISGDETPNQPSIGSPLMNHEPQPGNRGEEPENPSASHWTLRYLRLVPHSHPSTPDSRAAPEKPRKSLGSRPSCVRRFSEAYIKVSGLDCLGSLAVLPVAVAAPLLDLVICLFCADDYNDCDSNEPGKLRWTLIVGGVVRASFALLPQLSRLPRASSVLQCVVAPATLCRAKLVCFQPSSPRSLCSVKLTAGTPRTCDHECDCETVLRESLDFALLDGPFQLASFVRTHEKALANALQFQRREARHKTSQSTSAATIPQSTTPLPERPSTSASTSSSLAAALSLGTLNFTSHSVKSAKLALTPHHLFYLLSRFEELSINVGPMKIRLENLHDSSTSANYVSFLSNTQRSRSRGSDAGSMHSVSSIRSVMSGMSALWQSLGIGASISAARTERQKAALETDMKYLYSAFTKIPCLRLAPDWRARLIRGYEEFPFDSAVPLYAFKNLQALEISSIDFRQFFGWDRLADQLRSLTLKRAGIEDPADILIDIVLDDMDKRRRRVSKSQSSPTATWAGSGSPRRSGLVGHPELHRAASAPSSPDPRTSVGDMRVGSMDPSEHAIGENSRRPSLARNDTDESPKSLAEETRPRSNSPSRPTSSRAQSHTARGGHHRMRRSGSGSSHSSLSDSWTHGHARGSSGNLLVVGILPISKWRFLRHLSLADNSMTSIPINSLAPLSNTLYSLDLSSNLFSQVPDSLATLTALRALNLSHCMIDSLHSLTRNPLPAITALNLRANRLQSLAGVEKLYPLERLDMRDNRLVDPLELARMTGIPEIREIWVEGNPFTRTHKDHRITIFNLFRKTPGYTEDIIIDGTGPTYAERRQLVERPPIPESVPVVKPQAPEIPAVDVSKPTIIYGLPKEATVLRKERPVPRTIMSETNTSSTRRRKTPKRRIVDLATNDAPPSPAPVDLRMSNPSPRAHRVPISPDGNYRISHHPESQLLPPVVLSDSRSSSFVCSPDVPRIDTGMVPNFASVYPTNEASKDWKDSQDWDASGEIYRQKIEALRDKVGNGYLSALGEESWVPKDSADYTSAAAIRAAHTSHHVPPAQAIHSGRTLG